MDDKKNETIVKSDIDFDNRFWCNLFKVMHTRQLVGEINHIKIYFQDERTEKHHCRHLHARVSGERVHVEIKNERVIVKGNIDKNKEKVLKWWVEKNLDLIQDSCKKIEEACNGLAKGGIEITPFGGDIVEYI